MRRLALQRVAVLLLLLASPHPAAAAAKNNVTLLWCSDPVRPNETLMVQYASTAPLLRPVVFIRPVSGGGAAPVALAPPAHVTEHSLSFVVPADLDISAYEVSISSSGGAVVSNTIVANKPEGWWVQGDGGSFGTAGGWLRAFGHGLALPHTGTPAAGSAASAGEARPHLELRDLAQQLTAAAQRGDWVGAERAAQQAGKLASHHGQSLGDALATTLTLTLQTEATEAAPVVIHATNATEYAAMFQIPASIPAGEYHVAVSNGAAVGEMDTYYSHSQPRVSTVEIKAAGATAWGTRVVKVTDHGCVASLTNFSDQIDCTDAVLSAIAEVNGTGGTVQLGLGRFYIRAPLLLPNGVRIVGAGMGKTALYFASMNNSQGNPRSLIMNSEPGRFGLQDLDIYVLAFYVNVIHISADTDGVEIKRVRLRANAFHCQNGGTRQPPWHLSAGANCDATSDGCPNPWPYHVQPAIMLLGRNYEISDCDLWATWTVIYSGLTPPPPGPKGADPHECELQYKCQLCLELSIENARSIMENCPWKMMIF